MSYQSDGADRIPKIKSLADCRVLYWRFYPTHYIEHKEHSRCAFHDDKGPSLKLDKESCYCFGACKQSFDAIDIYMRGANCSRAEAINLLARELGPENSNSSQNAQGKKAAGVKKRDYTAEFEQALRTKAPPEAMAYLERRGLMGVLPELRERRLISFKSGSQDFPPAVVVPVMTPDISATLEGRCGFPH